MMRRRSLDAQRGTTAVEFAFTALLFFTLILGFVEMARAVYLWNTTAVVTRRYARALAVVDFTQAAAREAALQKAAFNSAGGQFPLSGPISADYYQVRYLRADAETPVTSLPVCPAQNLINCLADPNGSECIRFVEVRLCVPGTSCESVPYPALINLGGLFPATFRMPTFATLTPVESLGFDPTSSNCP